MNNRRKLIVALGGGALIAPLSTFNVRAQQASKVPRIGVLWHAGSEEEEAPFLNALRQGLSDFGFVDGQSIVLENRFPAEQAERFNSFAVELARLNPDVFVAVTPPAALAAQRATTTTPIVFINVADPVRIKLVDSLARPGGRITGLSHIGVDLMGKQLQLLREATGTLSRVAVLANPTNATSHHQYVEAIEAAARTVKVTVGPVEMVNAPDKLEDAFASITRAGAHGLIVLSDGLFYNERQRLAELALRYHLPAIFLPRQFAEVGGLMSYGPNLASIFRRAGYLINRILKGTMPADLPVEQPTQFEMIINLRTAKAMGLTIPQSLLLRADKVIQ